MTQPQQPTPDQFDDNLPEKVKNLRRGAINQAIRKIKEGKDLTPNEWRLFEADYFKDFSWPDRKACADELSEAYKRTIPVRHIYELKRQGAPIPNKGAIGKASLWRWLAVEKNEKHTHPDHSSSSLREKLLGKQIEMLQAKLDALRGTMLESDKTIRAIVSAGEKVKTSLLSELPTKVVEFAQTKSTLDAIEAVRLAITDALNSIAKLPEDISRKDDK
jgi:hypothetical protein